MRCFQCKKRGHIIANCRINLNKQRGVCNSESQNNNDDNTRYVELITVDQIHNTDCKFVESVNSTTVSKEILRLNKLNENIDELYWPHVVNATMERPDGSPIPLTLLRDTGSLQSCLRSDLLTDWTDFSTDEYCLIKGISGQALKLPLAQVC